MLVYTLHHDLLSVAMSDICMEVSFVWGGFCMGVSPVGMCPFYGGVPCIELSPVPCMESLVLGCQLHEGGLYEGVPSIGVSPACGCPMYLGGLCNHGDGVSPYGGVPCVG